MDDALNLSARSAHSLHGSRFKLIPLALVALIAIVLTLEFVSQSVFPRQSGNDRPENVEQGAGANRHESVKTAIDLREILAHPDLIPSHNHPLLGRAAIDFTLTDAEGKECNLREFRKESRVVLIFHYGFDCKNCVRGLCDIDRDLALFRELDARVVAISSAPPELTRPRLQQFGPLDFPVLLDPGNTIAHAYQVFRQDYLRHGTFLIDRQGVIRWVNVGDAPFRRNSALFTQLARIDERLPSGELDSRGGNRP